MVDNKWQKYVTDQLVNLQVWLYRALLIIYVSIRNEMKC